MSLSSSLVLFGEGFLSGLTLTVMIGPVTMTILRHGLQFNRTAGFMVAGGTWISDYFFIGITYWMTQAIEDWTSAPGNRMMIFLGGGLGLLILGVWMARTKHEVSPMTEEQVQAGYVKAFVSGVLVNSLSPFTLFFWLGVAVFLRMEQGNAFWYYCGLMISLGLGDSLKAWLAPQINKWLNAKYVYWIQVIAGLVIALAGSYVIYLGLTGKG